MHKKIKVVFVVISLALFITSVTQTAYCTESSNDDGCMSALMALLTGWMMPFGAGLAWFANPLLVAAWIFIFKNVKRALSISFIALLFALYFLFVDSVIINEAGSKSAIVSRNAGYWLWVSCIAVFVICTGCLWKAGGRKKN